MQDLAFFGSHFNKLTIVYSLLCFLNRNIIIAKFTLFVKCLNCLKLMNILSEVLLIFSQKTECVLMPLDFTGLLLVLVPRALYYLSVFESQKT